MEDNENSVALELGTPEAALRSCVNLFSRLFKYPEKYVACYLDMYYQLRRAAERQREAQAMAERPLGRYGKDKQPDSGPGDVIYTESPKESAEEKPETPEGFYPVSVAGNSAAANAAAEKRRIRERLSAMMVAGVSTRKIIRAADGNITEGQLSEIIDYKRIPIAVYRVLDAALDVIEKATADK